MLQGSNFIPVRLLNTGKSSTHLIGSILLFPIFYTSPLIALHGRYVPYPSLEAFALNWHRSWGKGLCSVILLKALCCVDLQVAKF